MFMGLCLLPLVSLNLLLGTLRLEDEDDYEYKFSVLSMCTSKKMSASEPYAHAQYGKLILVDVLRSKGP